MIIYFSCHEIMELLLYLYLCVELAIDKDELYTKNKRDKIETNFGYL